MIKMFDHGQVVLERELAQRIIFGRQQLFLPGIADAASLFGRSAIVGQLMGVDAGQQLGAAPEDRKSTRLNSSHGYISYAVFCLKKKKKKRRYRRLQRQSESSSPMTQ